MDLLNKLTIKNLKLNKKRTIVTIIGIMLSVALITAVSSLYASSISSLIKFETRQQGNFHYAYSDVPAEDINKFKANRKIDKLYLTKHLGYARINGSKNEYKPYAHIMAFTRRSLDNLSINLVEGRFPNNSQEIVIPSHLKTNGRITLNVGDKIELEVGDRVSDGNLLNQFNPYSLENNEEIINTTKKIYRVVGIIERPSTGIESYTAPGYTFITYLNQSDIEGNLDVYTRYTKDGLDNQYEVTANILGVDEKVFKRVLTGGYSNQEFDKYTEEMKKANYDILSVNSYLIKLETNPLEDSSTGGLGVVVLIVCGIIIFTSVFCIKNSFDISITEKIKQYGMLRSIGATKKQVKRNVFYEAFTLGAIGIPLGIFLGLLATIILILISNYFLKDMFTENLKLEFSLSWIAIIFSIILGIITIYLSAIRSARRASKISPITAIRNSGNITIKSKKIKSPNFIHNIFGVGGDISYKNIKRNKKKYRTTVFSIIVSVSIFIALSTFINLAFDAVERDMNFEGYTFILSAETNNDKEFYQKMVDTTTFPNIDHFVILRYRSFYIDNPNYSSKYLKAFNTKVEDLDGYLRIQAIGEVAYKKYIKELGLNYEEIKDKAILIDYQKISKYNENKQKLENNIIREYAYHKWDVIKGKDAKENAFEIEVGYITSEKPIHKSIDEPAFILISDEKYDEYFKEEGYVSINYQSSNVDKLQSDIEQALNGYNYNFSNLEENARMMKSLFTLLAIFLYGFIIVISLIGITNIFNTITANMELRRQEFAMLKSIGMTSHEFRRMIRLESIFMGVKSLLYGIPIGIILSLVIYYFLAVDSGISYSLPVFALIISILAVFILITCIMRYSMNKISKQNTIETIRNENI